MDALRRQILVAALKLSDLVLMAFCFGFSSVPLLYQSGAPSIAHYFSMRVKIQNFAVFIGFLIVWHSTFSLLGLHDSGRLSTWRAECLKIVKATSVGTLLILVAALLFRIRMVTPSFIMVFWCASSITTALIRLFVRNLMERLRVRGRNLRYILIVGTNPRAVKFARKIEAKVELGYRIVGFADDEWAGMQEFRSTGYKIACGLEGIPEFVRKTVIDEVIIALPVRSLYIHASRIVSLCEEQGVVTRLLSSIFNPTLLPYRAERSLHDSVITLYSGAPDDWARLNKRVLDFSISLLVTILLAPIFFITALVIKLNSSGPVLFKQRRVGLNKRIFFVYKFRTMAPDAEQRMREVEHLNEVGGPVFKIKNDPRITPVGRFLRKASIDELPQLFNVLKGDMSLVGPRPLPLRDYEGFSQDWHRRRFSVRPGITCLWQINGRSSISFEKWMELDMEYIDRWSLWLDLQILLRTLPVVLKGTGAA
jgi:exopolysaccharide biosynthesis polyprenyl glycosylphosphotransferase